MISDRRHRPAPRGLALVTVLLIVAVTTALAYEIANRHAFGVAVSRQVFSGSQAREYALGGEQYARQLLYADWEDEGTRSKDTLLEDWSSMPEAFEVEDGGIEMRIVDLSSRFNLNSLLGAEGPQNAARLKRLFTHLELDPKYVDAWVDWIDPDQEVQPYGAEDADYLLREPPHRAANQEAVDISELRLAVPFDSRGEYARLAPHVTVLPTHQLAININTVADAVLASLAPNFPAADAQLLVEQVRDYDDVEGVIASYAPLGASAAALRVGSQFFEVRVRVHVGETRTELTSVLHRDQKTGELTLLSRNFGRRVEAQDGDAADTEA
ncbi:MAG: type II secretion system minor pseudopilin GspK [Gammaproteobacteria bacterium]|nr:type II secretion system minor pseudopilin GspK [Gammaproteobacteria bacterium]